LLKAAINFVEFFPREAALTGGFFFQQF